MNKEEIVQLLESNVAKITFIKLNGEHREMLCTLIRDKIPEDKLPKGEKSTNDAVVAVYDLEKEAWRSFRLDSLIGEPEVQ